MKFKLSAASEGWAVKGRIDKLKKEYGKSLSLFNVEYDEKEDKAEIEISSIEELKRFMDEFGDLILLPSTWRRPDYEMVIYDDYVE